MNNESGQDPKSLIEELRERSNQTPLNARDSLYPDNFGRIAVGKPFGLVGLTPSNSGFMFGRKSKAEQKGVHPKLVEVSNLALTISRQDFCYYDGVRTQREQANYLKQGTTKTMHSKHMVQPDGFGHANDLVPWVNGKPSWDWDKIYPVVAAVDAAATHLGVADHIVWGGAWDRRLSDFGGEPEEYFRECQAYQTRHPGRDFIDGPHFEWRD